MKRFRIGRGTTNQRLDWEDSTADVIEFVGRDFAFAFVDRGRICCWTSSSKLELSWRRGGRRGGRIGAAGKTPNRGYVSYLSGHGIMKAGSSWSLDRTLRFPYWAENFYFSIVGYETLSRNRISILAI